MKNQETTTAQRKLTIDDAEFWEAVGGPPGDNGRKIRSDAILKNLSFQAQEQVAHWARKPQARDQTGEVIKGTGGLGFGLRMLSQMAEQYQRPELAVSASALSKFVEWWEHREKIEIAEERVAHLCAEMNPADIEKVRTAAEVMMLKVGIADTNVKMIAAAVRSQDSRRRLEQRDRWYALKREQVLNKISEEILKKAQEVKQQEIDDQKLTKAEVIARIRKAFFADVDATVVDLPP